MKNTVNIHGDHPITQIGNKIVNQAALVAGLHELRDQIKEVTSRDGVSPSAVEALRQAADDAERELASVKPRRKRLHQILASVATASTGLTATAGLTNSINALLKTLAGAE